MDINIILAGVQKNASGADPIGNTLKFDFGDNDLIYIDGTGVENTVTIIEEDKDADCVIIVSKENFIKLTTGDLNPMTAVMMGQIKIKGNMGVAMKLQSLL